MFNSIIKVAVGVVPLLLLCLGWMEVDTGGYLVDGIHYPDSAVETQWNTVGKIVYFILIVWVCSCYFLAITGLRELYKGERK